MMKIKKKFVYIGLLLFMVFGATLPVTTAPASAINVFTGCANGGAGGGGGGGAGGGDEEEEGAETPVPDAGSTEPSVVLAQSEDPICDEANNSDVPGLLANVTGLLFFLIGVIAVIVIIIAGLKYVTADGDPAKIKGAKETILYAVIGLIVAIMAYAIVTFVISSFS